MSEFDHPIRVYLISGFLGAGKTTFLRHVLEQVQHHRVGVIVNEFGSIGIDGKILQQENIQIVEINNGSIFCSCLKGGFIKTLIAFLDQPIDSLFIEASGMADPASMQGLLDQLPELVKKNGSMVRGYDYQGSICIVDCVTFVEFSEMFTPTRNQVIKSHFIVVNKTDLVSAHEVADVHEKIRVLNPNAYIYDTIYGKVSLDVLHSHIDVGDEAMPSSNQPWNRPVTYVLDGSGLFDKEKILSFCEYLAGKVIRVKGFFRTNDGVVHVNMVGDFINLEDNQDSNRVSYKDQKLVIIGKGNASIEDDIRKAWETSFDSQIEFYEP